MKPGVMALVVTLAGAGHAAAQDWLALNLPPRTQAEWVIERGRVNGVPTQVQQIESELSPEELIGFFQRDWLRLGGSTKRGQFKDWLTLVLQREPLQVVLQVQRTANGRGAALLSQMNLRDVQRDFLPPELPNLPQGHVSQVTESVDGPRRSRLVQMTAGAGFEPTQARLRSHWLGQGWAPLHDQTRKENGGRQWLASYARAERSVDIVMAQPPGSGPAMLTVNLLDAAP